MYTVGQMARICNVSTKTLRHYDEIGLFRPAAVGADNQYRYYTHEQIPVIRKVLFLRDLGVPLDDAKGLIEDGSMDDPARLAAFLQERAGVVRGEIDSRLHLLSRIEQATAQLGREKEWMRVEQQAVTLKDLPEVQVVGVRKTIPIGEIGGLFGQAARQMRSRPAGPPMTLYYDQDFDPEKADVEVLFPVVARGQRTLPATKVVSTVHVGPYDRISGSYAAIFDWVNRNGWRQAGPPREIYLVGPESKKRPEEYATEIQIPVESSDR